MREPSDDIIRHGSSWHYRSELATDDPRPPREPYPERGDVWRLDGDVVRVLAVHTDGRTLSPDPVDIRHSDGLERAILVTDLMHGGKLIAHEHRYPGTTSYLNGLAILGPPYRCRCGKLKPIDRLLFDPVANANAAIDHYRAGGFRWYKPGETTSYMGHVYSACKIT